MLISIYGLTHSQYQNIAIPIAKSFSAKFSSDFETRVIYQATQEDLYSALNNPQSVGVFWLSHSNSGIQASGIGMGGSIVDSKGVDVSRVFTKIHPNIKWIGVIGCKALPIFKGFADKGFYKDKNIFLHDQAFNWNALVGMDHSTSLTSFSGLVISSSTKLALTNIDSDRNFKNATTYLQRLKRENQLTDVQTPADSNVLRFKVKRVPDHFNKNEMVAVQVLVNSLILLTDPES
ncbi:MAG TPA: hypothetical protein VIG33_08685 [Pseudobdellovibrionaceae bacterium]